MSINCVQPIGGKRRPPPADAGVAAGESEQAAELRERARRGAVAALVFLACPRIKHVGPRTGVRNTKGLEGILNVGPRATHRALARAIS